MTPKILVAQGGGPTAVINQSLAGVVLEARKFPMSAAFTARTTACAASSTRICSTWPRRRANLETVARRPPRRSARPATSPTANIATKSSRCCRPMKSAPSSISAAMIPPTPCASSRGGEAGRLSPALHPYSQDHRQRSGRQRPYAGLSLGGAFRRPGLRRRQSRQRRPARRLCRRGDGPPCRLPYRCGRARAKYPDDGPHLIYVPERVFDIDKFLADVKATFDRLGRCMIAVSEGIHDAEGAPIITKLGPSREGRAWQHPALRHRRARRPAVRGNQDQARHQARARRHLRLSATLLHRLRLRRRSARGARGRREGGAIRACGAQATARWRSGASAIMRSITR